MNYTKRIKTIEEKLNRQTEEESRGIPIVPCPNWPPPGWPKSWPQPLLAGLYDWTDYEKTGEPKLL